MYQTAENFAILQFKFDVFIDINDKEKACKQFKAFKSHLKIIILQTKSFNIKGKHMLFQKKCYCIYSNKVKKKQGIYEMKNSQSIKV